MGPIAKRWGNFTAFYYGKEEDTSLLVRRLLEAPVEENKGRGGIKFLDMGARSIVCRKYLHGGLFRILTGDRFMSSARCRREGDIMDYLSRRGFPTAQVVCALCEERGLTKRLYLMTLLIGDSTSLLEYLNQANARERLRMVKRFAELLWDLERAGIFHPDLHLNNLLVTSKKDLFFLDFDKACRRTISAKDVESMLWRLARFVEKMEKQGKFRADPREMALFLRVYEQLSGRRMERVMAKKAQGKTALHRIGWFVECLLYGR